MPTTATNDTLVPPLSPLALRAAAQNAPFDNQSCPRWSPGSRSAGDPGPTRHDPSEWLTLNTLAPDPGTAGLPVMVWIYGGAYRFGSSAEPGYDGAALSRGGRVVVTANHRVGFDGSDGHGVYSLAGDGVASNSEPALARPLDARCRAHPAAFAGDRDK